MQNSASLHELQKTKMMALSFKLVLIALSFHFNVKLQNKKNFQIVFVFKRAFREEIFLIDFSKKV